jgi:toxin YoeB
MIPKKYIVILDEMKLKKDLKQISLNKKLAIKLTEILKSLEVDPYNPSFKFERLKGNLSGFCSKRLNQKDRVVYQVEDEIVTVFVVSITGHY